MEELDLPVLAVTPPEAAEPAPLPGEAPAPYAVRAATAKAACLLPLLTGPEAGGFAHYAAAPETTFLAGGENTAAAPNCPVFPPLPANGVVIAADTVVALEGRILGKPENPAQALDFLRLLSGKTHEVITGCALESKGLCERFASRTWVSMWKCPDELLAAYAWGGEPMDKAGAYAIQGEGALLVDSIRGSWSNVVGLPMAEIIQALLRMGAVEIGK